jgi:prevent-host-death family protein
MQQFNIAEAKAHLSELVQKAMMGEEIVIARDNKPLAMLVPIKRARRANANPDRARGKSCSWPMTSTRSRKVSRITSGDCAARHQCLPALGGGRRQAFGQGEILHCQPGQRDSRQRRRRLGTGDQGRPGRHQAGDCRSAVMWRAISRPTVSVCSASNSTTSPPSKPCPCITAIPSTACWSHRQKPASCPWSVPTGRFPTTASNASGNRHATN